MGYGVDRTFSAQQWRVVVYAACGVLVAGIGLGVLIGRLTAPTPEPPPASASILPDVLPSTVPAVVTSGAGSDDDTDAPPPVAAVPPPAPVPPAPVAKAPLAPVVQKPSPPERVAAPKPERVAPKPVEAKAKPVPAAPEPPAGGARWVVQLGAFQSSDHANLLVNTLAAHGQPAHVTFAQNAAGQGWFYVQTSPYRSAAAAKSAAQGLAAREHLPTYVLKLPDAG